MERRGEGKNKRKKKKGTKEKLGSGVRGGRLVEERGRRERRQRERKRKKDINAVILFILSFKCNKKTNIY